MHQTPVEYCYNYSFNQINLQNMKETMIAVFSAFICIHSYGQGPVIEWKQSLGGSGNEIIYSIRETADGGYIAAGSTESNDGDITGNNGDRDALLIKFTANGSVAWHKTYGGTGAENARSVFQTTEGGYIFTGSANSDDGDVSSNHGGNDVWVVKLDNQGEIEWEKTYGGMYGDAGYSIVPATTGGYIVGGQSNSSDGDLTENNGMTDYWVFKIDASGTLIWQSSFGGGNADYGRKLIETSEGDIVIVGYSDSANGDLTENKGAEDGWIIKLSETGTLIWQKSIGGSGSDYLWDVIESTGGSYVLTGSTTSNNGDVTGNNGSLDTWVVQVDEQGTIEWGHTFGGSDVEEGYQIAEASAGNFVIFGTAASANGDVSTNQGEIDYWMFAVNAAGTIQWEKTIGGSSWDIALAGTLTSDGGFVIAGSTSSSDGDVVENNGLDDAWIVKLSQEGLGISTIEQNEVIVYPTMTNGPIVIQSEKPIEQITVYTITGETVLTISGQSGSTVSLDISSLKAGNYLMEIVSDNMKNTRKVIRK